MNPYEEVEDSLWIGVDHFLQHIGKEAKVIFSHASGLEPKGNYIVIQVIELDDIGSAWKSSMLMDKGDYGSSVINNGYEVLVGFRFHGDDAGSIGHQFDTLVKNSEQVRWMFQLNGLSPLNKNTLRRVPILKEEKWHDVFSVDVRFTYTLQTEEKVDWIESVGIHNLNNDEKMCIDLNKKQLCEENNG